MKRIACLIAALAVCQGSLAYAAPAPDPDPVVDLEGVSHDQYVKDLAECRALAEAAVPAAPVATTTKDKVKSGAVGAAKAASDAVAKNGLNLIQGAGTFVKDVSGQTAATRKHTIAVNCLKGRGYAVLE